MLLACPLGLDARGAKRGRDTIELRACALSSRTCELVRGTVMRRTWGFGDVQDLA
jgi:hypothetical protein